MQDIRKWFVKPHSKGNDNSSKAVAKLDPDAAVPNGVPPASVKSEKVVQGDQESSGRRKTSKYFPANKQEVKDEIEEIVDTRKSQRRSEEEPRAKKLQKFEEDDNDDFVLPAPRKSLIDETPRKRLKNAAGRAIAPKSEDIDESELNDLEDKDVESPVKSNRKGSGGRGESLASGRGRHASSSAMEIDAETNIKSPVKSGGRGRGGRGESLASGRGRGGGRKASSVAVGLDESDEENIGGKDNESPAKPAGRGRGGKGVAAPSGAGRGRGGGRGGFANFGERSDPPHKGEKEVPEGAPDCLAGFTFVISGTLDSLEREEAEDLIKRHGGRVTGSISKKTNYLLCDEDIGGRKSAKAKELGTKFLTEDGLLDMIRASAPKKTHVQCESKKTVEKAVASVPKTSPQKVEIKKDPIGNSSAKTVAPKALTSGFSPAKTNAKRMAGGLTWTEKYKPKTPNEIIGNQSVVKQLHDWLTNWNNNFLNTDKKGKGKNQNDTAAKKAILLSGTPGIGKTTSAKLVSEMLGFQTIEVNASDSRGKANSQIHKGIGGSTANSVKELVSNEGLNVKMDWSKHPKSVLIMDEVDGMSAGDRGGVADLIMSIKISRVPIICICNDRYSQKLKSLVNYCLLLNFRKPTKQQMAKRLMQIANSEGLKVNEVLLEREEAEDLIKRHGGRVTGSISKKTNYLLCDEDIGGRKSAKAKELGTKFLTEDGLLDMIRASAPKKTHVQCESKKTVEKAVASVPKTSPQKVEIKKDPIGNSSAKTVAPKALTSGFSPAKTNAKRMAGGLTWTEKYKPKTPNEIIGNQSVVKQLHDWLTNWNNNFLNTDKKGKGKNQNDTAAKKAILLSGTPGIGKTTSAKLVSEMLGFQTIEVNASDSRGKANSQIHKGIGGSTANSVKELVSNEGLNVKMDWSKHPKSVLIMDEVDGMSAGDRGGVADLIMSIKISRVPIICICNDRYSQKLKSLVNYCLLLNFRKPTKQQMAKRLMQIANSEGLKVNEIALEELAERVNGDMRMALNQLQYMSLSMSVINYDDIRKRLLSSAKDEDMSPFTAVDKLLGFNGGKLRMDERIDFSMSDPDLVPLLIQENYINYRPSLASKDDNGIKRLNLIARAAESIGDGDIVNVQIRRYQKWQLSQTSCLSSCIIPAALMHGQREVLEQGERNFNRFGAWLGKNSSMGKNRRLLEDLHYHILASSASNIGRDTLRLDYLTAFPKQMADPLKQLPKDEAVKKTIEFMNEYSISLEDFDTITELLKFKGRPNPMEGIESTVKAALTRGYKKSSSRVRTADVITLPGMKKAPKKRIAAMLEPVDDSLGEENANTLDDGEEEEESSDGDPVNDAIKLESNLQGLNSKGIKVELNLKGTSSSSLKKTPAGRGKGSSSSVSSQKKGAPGRDSGAAAAKRKR